MVSFEDAEKEMENIRTLLSLRVDGIILDPTQNHSENTNYEMHLMPDARLFFITDAPANILMDQL